MKIIRKRGLPSAPPRTVELTAESGADPQIVYDSGSSGSHFTLGPSATPGEAAEPVYTAQGLYFANKLVRGSRTPFQASENRTILILFAAAARGSSQLFTIGGQPFGLRLLPNGTLRFLWQRAGETTVNTLDTSLSDTLYQPGTFHMASLRKSTVGGLRLGIDESFTLSAAETAPFNNVSTGFTQFGRNSDNGFAFTGTIAHFCFWDSALSDADLKQGYDYMLAYNARRRAIGVPGPTTLLTA